MTELKQTYKKLLEEKMAELKKDNNYENFYNEWVDPELQGLLNSEEPYNLPEISINRVRNGYILKVKQEDGKYTAVIQEKDAIDDRKSECLALIELFNFLSDVLGVYNSKHEKVNLVMGVSNSYEQFCELQNILDKNK
jgi:hypothetical protein